MTFANTFNFQEFTVIVLLRAITVMVILLITETLILDSDFLCPRDLNTKAMYIVFILFTPFVALTCFSAILQRKSRICCGSLSRRFSCKICLRIFYPAFCWCVVLLMDGKYIICAFSEKPIEGPITQEKISNDPDMLYLKTVSQISGLLLFCILSLGFFFSYYWKDRYSCNRSTWQAIGNRFITNEADDMFLKNMYDNQMEDEIEELMKTFTKETCKTKMNELRSQLYEGDPNYENKQNPAYMKPRDITVEEAVEKVSEFLKQSINAEGSNAQSSNAEGSNVESSSAEGSRVQS